MPKLRNFMIILCFIGCILILIGFFSNWITISIYTGALFGHNIFFGPESFSGYYFSDGDPRNGYYTIMEAGYYPLLFLIPIAAIMTIFVTIISRIYNYRIIGYLQWLTFTLLILCLILPIDWYDKYTWVEGWKDIRFVYELEFGWFLSLSGAFLSLISFSAISKFHFSSS